MYHFLKNPQGKQLTFLPWNLSKFYDQQITFLSGLDPFLPYSKTIAFLNFMEFIEYPLTYFT